MRSIRKLLLVGLAALMACAALASAASALEAQDSSGTPLAVGSQLNGLSTNSTLHGTFFGIAVTITCTQSSWVGTITANSPTPTGNLNSLTWTGCKNSSGTACTVTSLNLPWNGSVMANSTTSISITVPSNGGVQISGTGCLPLSSTCTFGAGETVNFAWSNANSTATVSQDVHSSVCGTGTWTSTYTVRTGGTVGSGSTVQLV